MTSLLKKYSADRKNIFTPKYLKRNWSVIKFRSSDCPSSLLQQKAGLKADFAPQNTINADAGNKETQTSCVKSQVNFVERNYIFSVLILWQKDTQYQINKWFNNSIAPVYKFFFTPLTIKSVKLTKPLTNFKVRLDLSVCPSFVAVNLKFKMIRFAIV